MRQITRRQKNKSSALGLASLLFLPIWGWGQQVGKVVAIEGIGEYSESSVVDWALLYPGDGVAKENYLRTRRVTSKLGVLLLTGHEFVLSADVEVQVREEGTEIVLLLHEGTVRLVTSGRPGDLIVARTSTGVIKALSTGFIVSCGPPTTPSAEICLFVGVYGRAQVESLAFPGRPVTLSPRFFTLVRKNQLPDPPRLMPDAQFQALLEDTTILGTGSEQDRIGMTDLWAAGKGVLRPEDFIAPVSEPPSPQVAGPGTRDSQTILDQPPAVYDPDQGGTPPDLPPLPEPPILPPPP